MLVQISGCQCDQCSVQWVPRVRTDGHALPFYCPKCGSAKWDIGHKLTPVIPEPRLTDAEIEVKAMAMAEERKRQSYNSLLESVTLTKVEPTSDHNLYPS